ncbi:atlastin-2-like isoform X5 [Amblyomma americanum]
MGSTMEHRLSKGKVVQILRMSKDDSFTLEERQLEAILLDERVKDKHVAVVSVAGAYRQGKSFLLSFLLRFLWHQCHSNWLDDTSIPLGGFQWSPGSKRHTTGIQLWSQPFLVTTPQGDEVAVLLMDTQGSFDCTSSVKECTTIFALSIMTSSVQVYNIFRDIQEDSLQHLEFFSEYGKLARKEARKCMFQRLVFLVRDWAFPYETEFGVEGGRTVLQDRLQIIDGQHADLQTLRRQINACFSKIECFLMPRPGEKVETDKSFDGYLEDIDGKFKEALKELVPWLLAPENLVVKEINGHKITCEELMKYFRAYATAFQGGTLPSPKTVLQATVEASNMVAKEKATNFYLDAMNRSVFMAFSASPGPCRVASHTPPRFPSTVKMLLCRRPVIHARSPSFAGLCGLHWVLSQLSAALLSSWHELQRHRRSSSTCMSPECGPSEAPDYSCAVRYLPRLHL